MKEWKSNNNLTSKYKSTEVCIERLLVDIWQNYPHLDEIRSLKWSGQEGLEKDMVVGSGEAIADQLKSV